MLAANRAPGFVTGWISVQVVPFRTAATGHPNDGPGGALRRADLHGARATRGQRSLVAPFLENPEKPGSIRETEVTYPAAE